MRKIFTAGIIFLLFASESFATAKWQTLTFQDDVTASMNELERYCITHDVTVNDVLWANNIASNDVQAGTVIYLPKNQADMLSIWQNKGAWNPHPFLLESKGKAVRKILEEKQPSTTQGTPKIQPTPVKVAANSPPLENMELPEMTENNFNMEGLFVTMPDLENNSSSMSDDEEIFAKLKQDVEASTPPEPTPEIQSAQVSTPAPVSAPKIAQTPRQAPKPETPANVIAQTAKPDKILTAKPKKPAAEIPNIMDPIIILSPNGDSYNGPMRLMISGDKVEVVRLPQNALPRTPTMDDANITLSKLPNYYSVITPMPQKNNNNANLYAPNLNGKMLWPVDGRVSSPFGWRGKRKHEGIDIPMPAGTPIRAAKTGTVSRTGNNSTVGFRGYGNFVLMDHGGGVQSFYAHCQRVIVSEGQRVMQGEIIGYVGSTGRSTANHLHFEVRVNNTKVNPMNYLAGNTHYASK